MSKVDWSNLAEFPHPNPYFPSPPRPVRRLGCLGALLCMGAATGIWTVMDLLGDRASGFTKFMIFILGCGPVVLGILIANERLSAGPWIKGPVVPARVYVAPKGPPASLVWHAVGFIPVVGLLISAIAGWVTGPRNRVQLVYFKDGMATDAVFLADRFWKQYQHRLDIWICVNKKGEVVPLVHIAPRRFQNVEVPAEVSAWIDSRFPSEYAGLVDQRRLAILEEDTRSAAKANTKAFKRASQYDKRPG